MIHIQLPKPRSNKWQVFKTLYGQWRFTNLHGIAGDCDTWAQAYDEAHALAMSEAVAVA